MYEASKPGHSGSDVKWQQFLDDRACLLKEKFTADKLDPFIVEVEHNGKPKTIKTDLRKGAQRCPETDCARKIMRIAILYKGTEGVTGLGRSEGPAFAGPGSASLESPKEEKLAGQPDEHDEVDYTALEPELDVQ